MEPQVIHIDSKPKLGLELGQIWHRRELLFFFVWRNFKVRYKQTIIGAGWAVLRPLIMMIVFTVFFNKTLSVGTGAAEVPYPIFSYVGLLFWTYFAQTTVQVGESMVANQSIFKKIYFPRLIIPLSTTLTGLIDFFIATGLYLILMFYYSIFPELAGILLFLPMLILCMITVLGVGAFMAALNVRYRDIGQALPFLIQVLLFLSPVIAPASIVSETWRWVIFLNPIAGVIETMRATLLGAGSVDPSNLLISVASGIVLLVGGVAFFKKQERSFADIV